MQAWHSPDEALRRSAESAPKVTRKSDAFLWELLQFFERRPNDEADADLQE